MVKTSPTKSLPLIMKELSKLAGVGASDVNSHTSTTKKTSNIISFRDEFPFLNRPDCPMELKALVTDKFTSFYRYRDLHKQLWDCSNAQECANLSADIIESYLENRSIYAELDYYKKHRSVLGKHPIFKHYHKMSGLRQMGIKDLVKLQIKLEHNIWRIESEIKKNDKPYLQADRHLRLHQKQSELAEVNRLLE